jgi:hypothetical protein
MRSLRKMQLAAAAGTGAAVASYAVDRPLQASLFLAAVPLSVVAIYLHRLTAKTLEHMGSSGQQLSEMSAAEYLGCMYGFFTWRGLKEILWVIRVRNSSPKLKVGEPAPDVKVFTLPTAGDEGEGAAVQLLELAAKGRALVLNFGSCT